MAIDDTATTVGGTGEDIEVGVRIVSTSVQKSNDELVAAGQAMPDEGETMWGGALVLKPPLDPAQLLLLYSVSDVLQQCVDAMVQNVDGYGWVAEPTMNLDAEDALDQVATALTIHQLAESPPGDFPEPPDEQEVQDTLAKWRRRAIQEKAAMRVFFDSLCFEGTFADLRKRRSTDEEVVGWACWEVIRNAAGRVVRLRHIPAHTMRLTAHEDKPINVPTRRPTSPVTHETIPVAMRLRRIVQLNDMGTATYFKEYGDPRFVSAESGTAYPTEAEFKKKEPKAVMATEALYFARYFPGSPYGQPRWHGLTPSVIGNRLVQDINVEFLDDSAIPRGLLLVSDGRIGPSSRNQLDNFFDTKKGKAHNRMAVIEAVTPKEQAILEGSGRVQVQWIPLREAQRDDATFSQYAETNRDMVGESFRLPPMLRGKVKDLNRATAFAALEYAEEQVFAPTREDFDAVINRTLVADLGVRFWRFKSRGPKKHDPETQAKIADIVLKHGAMTPAEIRPLLEHMLGIDLLDSAQPYMRYPMPMLLAGHVPPEQQQALTPGAGAEAPPGEEGEEGGAKAPPAPEPAAKASDPDSIARAILGLRAQLERSRAASRQAALIATGHGGDSGDG